MSLLFPLSGLIILVCCLFRKDKILHELIYTKGFIVSLFIFAFVIILHWGRTFAYVDEFAHWGLMVKESFRLKEFYCVTDSLMYYNKDYPPFFSLLETFWCLVSNKYEERLCYMAINFTELSFFLPIIDGQLINLNKIKTIVVFILTLIIGLVIGYTPSLAYNTFFYNCIYIDWPLAYLIGFLFITIFFKKDKWDYLFICIGLSALVLTKQISIAFYLLIIVYFLVMKTLRKDFKVCDIWRIVLVILIPLIMLKSWNILITSYGLDSKFDITNLNLLFPLDYVKGNLSETESLITSNFISAVIHNGVISWPIKISYLSFMIIIPFGIAIFGYKDNLKDSITTAILYFIGGIGYAYAMLISYVYLFGYVEGPALTMFDRYMLIYVLAGIYILFNLYITKAVKRNETLLALFILICIFIRPGTVKNSLPQIKNNSIYKDLFSSLERYDKEIEENAKVLVISQSNAEKQAAMRYILPYNTDRYTYLDIVYGGDYVFDEGQVFWENDFREYLSNFDYIYLLDFDESFTDNFWYTDIEAKEGMLYRIRYWWQFEIYFDPIT